MADQSPPARPHSGVAERDTRNAAPIEEFRPRQVTRAYLYERLAPYYRTKTVADLIAKVDAVADKVARAATRPPPPLWQALESVPDPLYGLGTHPDIVDELWRLDRALPRSCRLVFWGKPALAHPETGVVFAVGYGNIALAMRLPAGVLATAPPERVKVACSWTPGQRFDISGAGPEWRFVFAPAPEEWARAAYDFAGEAA